MKIYPVEFEVFDDANDLIATFKAIDEESLEIDLKESIWLPDEFYKLADAYKISTKQLNEGIEI